MLEYNNVDTDWPICPYCFFENTDTYHIDHNYKYAELKCPYCHRKYSVNIRSVITYTTKKIGE